MMNHVVGRENLLSKIKSNHNNTSSSSQKYKYYIPASKKPSSKGVVASHNYSHHTSSKRYKHGMSNSMNNHVVTPLKTDIRNGHSPRLH